MSLEGAPGEADRAGSHSQELNRRLRRPEMLPSTPPSGQRQLPKVLSHIAKQPAVAQVEKHSAATANGVTGTENEAVTRQSDEDTERPISSVIGLDLLQEQVRRLALRKGFTLNVMVVGIYTLVERESNARQ